MKLAKKIISITMALTMALGMAACSSAPSEEQPQQETEKPVLLAVSFGTSYNETRKVTIDAVESSLQQAYPDYEVRRAFTSQIIIDILAEREKMEIDNVTQAMERLVSDGVKEVVVQPTHIMNGAEYDDIVKEIGAYKDKFDSIKMGKALLTTDEDFTKLAEILCEETKDYDNEETAVVFMGHGTHHQANEVYGKLQETLKAAGHENYLIGTVEGSPTLDDVVALAKEGQYKKVVLLPLMIVAGDHANNDMAGDEEDSWKTILTNEGFEVECVLKGLGEYKGVQQMIIDHAAQTMAE